jgi:hypothetical protein
MSQPFGFSCRGGLNTNLNQLEMLAQPGVARELVNFEVDSDGGYRRINGFSPFGGASATRPEADQKILGIVPYSDGVVVCVGTNIYFSIDGITWLQINRASVSSTGDNYATFTGRSVLSRPSQGQSSFVIFEGATFDYGELIIADGANKPYFFRMEGTGDITTRTFFADEITVDGTNGVKYITIHDHHLIASGVENNLNTVYYSVYNDPDNFTGAGAGAVTISDQITGIKGFREDLIVFAENSIHKLININDASSIRIDPITENVGCLSGYSIQEAGGDLLFLAPDGIRTIAGTVRIGDVELSSVSRQIQDVIQNITRSISSYEISSAVIRNKSQYRLFYSLPTGESTEAKGIIGSLTVNGYEWSETLGIQAFGLGSGFNEVGIEKYYHGDKDGYIYVHDDGDYFTPQGVASNIRAIYKTPDFDFGDIGTRKTLKYVRLSLSPEGNIQPTLRVRYDYDDFSIPQPSDYILSSLPLPALFGQVTFGAAVFGASNDPMARQTVEGTGNTCSFKIFSEDQKAPYSINGLYVDYMPAGRR